MSNRSFQKIIYGSDVHYVDDEGKLKEIDHTLIDTSDVASYVLDEVIGYEANSNLNLKFSKKLIILIWYRSRMMIIRLPRGLKIVITMMQSFQVKKMMILLTKS